MKIQNSKFKIRSGFSLVELLVVIVIIGILSTVSFVAIQRARSRALNEKMLNDLVVIAQSLEDYRRDHQQEFPIPTPGGNQNVLCYYADATYAHDCTTATFIQGMIDNNLLSKRYLREVPTDPRTGSRYVYGVTQDGKFYQVAGLFEREDGTYEARTIENLAKGFQLPSIIRAFNSPNFVTDKETYLPYSPDHLVLTVTLDNVNGMVLVNGKAATNGMVLQKGDTIKTASDGTVDLFYSDGSETHVDPDTEVELANMEIAQNNKDGIVTKILIKLNAGKIWSKVVRLAENSEFNVETTSAIAGVRGTEFSAESDDVLEVLWGEVWQVKGKVYDTVTPDETEAPANQLTDLSGDIKEYIAPTDDYFNKYLNVPLHSGIHPHLLSVREEGGGGIIQVRNVNFFVDQVNRKQGVDTGPYARRMEASRLAVYSLDPARTPTFVKEFPDIIAQTTNPYEITGLSIGEEYVVRFEYVVDTEIIRHSAFSQPPVAIQANTNLRQEDLYPNEGDRPTLTLRAPSFFPLPDGAVTSPPPFALQITIDPDPPQTTGEMTYSITSIPIAVCDPTTANGTSTVSSFSVDINATAIGTCELNVSITLPNGQKLTKNASVRIISETQQLVLEYPLENAVLTAVGTSALDVDFRWSALNELAGTTYEISIDGGVALPAPGNNYLATGLGVGSHSWTVTMTPPTGVAEERPANFVITQIAGGVDFTITATDTDGNASTVPEGVNSGSLSATNLPVTLNFALQSLVSGYTYTWTSNAPSFAINANNMTANAQVTDVELAQDTSLTYTATVTIRDETTNNFVADMTKTITISYGLPPEPEITSIVFINQDGTTIPPISISNIGTLNLSVFSIQIDTTNQGPDGTLITNPDCLYQANNGTVDATNIYTPNAGFVGDDTIGCVLNTAPTGYILPTGPTTANLTIGITSAGPICGDGIIETPEQCDEGIQPPVDGDGCSANCAVETGWTCTGTPSNCLPTTSSTCATAGGAWDNVNTTCLFGVEGTCFTAGGHWDGTACWVLGTGSDSCDTTCNNLDGSNTGTGIDCVVGNWNDDNPNCSICQQLQSGAGCATALNKGTYAPFYDSNIDKCNTRDSVDFTGNPLIQDCSATTGPANQRTCKCQ